MSIQNFKKIGINKKVFLSVFFLILTIFVFSSDAHRFSGDEDWMNLQAIRMVTLEPHPLYVDQESRIRFEYPVQYPIYWQGSTCYNYVLCSPAEVAASVTQVPLLFINHNLNIISDDTVTWTNDDFNDLHYVFWRNSIDPDFTFLELFYGPIFSALSVSVFFLISRSFNFQIRTSVILTLLLGLSTPFWAYSQTTLSTVPMIFVLLLGFYFFRRFQKNDSSFNLIFCGMCLGFGFLVRQEMAISIIIFMGYFIYNLVRREQKIKKILCYLIPQILFYGLGKVFDYVGTGGQYVGLAGDIGNVAMVAKHASHYSEMPFLESLGLYLTQEFGLLLSPGVGLLFFVPILFTMFFAFPDFFRKHKSETVFFLSLMAFYMIQMGGFGHWHGLVAWSTRYLIPCIPFLLLPLGASIENRRDKKLIIIIIIILGSLGFLINLAYISQDVSWFVWGQAGHWLGLYSLGNDQTALYLNDAVIWTFQYSQLTNSIMTLFTGFYPDIFLLKLMGSGIFSFAIFSLLSSQIYILYRILKHSKISEITNEKTI